MAEESVNSKKILRQSKGKINYKQSKIKKSPDINPHLERSREISWDKYGKRNCTNLKECPRIIQGKNKLYPKRNLEISRQARDGFRLCLGL